MIQQPLEEGVDFYTLINQANGNKPRTDAEKAMMIDNAADAYGQFLRALGFNYERDPNSAETPRRVAKSWVNDLIAGTNSEAPNISAFPGEKYDGLIFQGNIRVTSMCSHHNLPFTGIANVAYIAAPGGKVIGLSKLNRIVDFYARRPQLQEALTMQIFNHISENTDNLGVAVHIQAKHQCVCNRGIKHDSGMQTAKFSGYFFTNELGTKDEFYSMILNQK